MFERKSVNELIELAANGAGFELKANLKSTNDLTTIALAAKRGGARITFSGMKLRPHKEIMQIARAGGGNITFTD